jgi:hypothetical protein
MPWWRQAHVCLDIACGLAIFAFVLWARGYLAIGTRQPRVSPTR